MRTDYNVRHELIEKAEAFDYKVLELIQPTAYVCKTAVIGKCCHINSGAIVKVGGWVSCIGLLAIIYGQCKK